MTRQVATVHTYKGTSGPLAGNRYEAASEASDRGASSL